MLVSLRTIGTGCSGWNDTPSTAVRHHAGNGFIQQFRNVRQGAPHVLARFVSIRPFQGGGAHCAFRRSPHLRARPVNINLRVERLMESDGESRSASSWACLVTGTAAPGWTLPGFLLRLRRDVAGYAHALGPLPPNRRCAVSSDSRAHTAVWRRLLAPQKHGFPTGSPLVGH